MPDKNPGKSGRTQPRKNDDFRLIRGITRNFKVKLYENGIRTFDQLANLTPSEVLAAIGAETDLTVDRIKRDDWIGQARKLVEEAEALKVESQAPDSDPRETYASFALELKLDQDNRVDQTRILFVGGKGKDAEEKWPGWDPGRVARFVEKCVGIKSDLEAPDVIDVTPEEIEEAPRSERARKPDVSRPVPVSSQAVSLNRFQVISAARNQPVFSFNTSEQYRVDLEIDASSLSRFAGRSMQFQAAVKAKNLKNSAFIDIGDAKGTIDVGQGIPVSIDCRQLPAGDYRLSALVTVTIPNNGSTYDVKSMLDGSLVHVW